MCNWDCCYSRGFLAHASKGNRLKVSKIKHREGAGKDP